MQEARELGLKASLTADSCSLRLCTLAFLMQFSSMCCVPVSPVSVASINGKLMVWMWQDSECVLPLYGGLR